MQEDLPVVEVRDVNLTRVLALGEDDLAGLTVTPTHNAVGSWSLSLPVTVGDDPHLFAQALAAPGAGIVVTFSDGRVFSGPVDSQQRTRSAKNPDGEWSFTGSSDLTVLAGEVAWPDPANLTAPARANDTRTGPRETLLHAYVAANGARIPRLIDSMDMGAGDTITKSPRFQNLLELCQEIASDQVCFDVVQDGDQLRFVTWTPADRTIEVQLDYDTGALSSMTTKTAGPKYTRAIVLGQDEGVLRQVTEVTTPQTASLEAVWGRRVLVKDQRQTDDIAEQVKNTQDELLDEANLATASTEAFPSDDLVLGDARPGDWVSVVDDDEPYRVQLASIPRSWSDGGLTAATVGDPITGDSAIWASLAASQRRLTQRLNALERSR